MGQEIARLKARSKHVAQQRSDEHALAAQYDSTLDGSATPTPLRGSRNELAALEREEREFLDKWRALRDKGKKLRIEEESLEQSTVPPENTLDLSDPLRRPQIVDAFPAGHQQWSVLRVRATTHSAVGSCVTQSFTRILDALQARPNAQPRCSFVRFSLLGFACAGFTSATVFSVDSPRVSCSATAANLRSRASVS